MLFYKDKKFWWGYASALFLGLIVVGFMVYQIFYGRPVSVLDKIDKVKFVNVKTGDTLTVDKVAKNDVMMLNYWATFCEPCIKEMPLLSEFAKQNPNLPLWLVSTEDSSVINKFIKKHPELAHLNFAHLITSVEHKTGFNTVAGTLPSTFLVKKDGEILWNHDGSITATAEQLFIDIQKKYPNLKK